MRRQYYSPMHGVALQDIVIVVINIVVINIVVSVHFTGSGRHKCNIVCVLVCV